MGKMNIDINIAGQEEGKLRMFYLVLGLLGTLYIAIMLFLPDLGMNHFYFGWILFLPGFIKAILYGLGKKRTFADNSPYLRINEERLEKSSGGIFSKQHVYYWTDVKALDIKLFEIQLTSKDNKVMTVALNNLTDDNLKIVKEFVTAVKKNKGL